MASTSTAIQDSLDNIESEIARLEKARDALLELVAEGDGEVEEAPKARRSTRKAEAEKPARRSRRATKDEDEEETPRRSRRTDKRAEERKASRRDGNGNGGGKTSRKEQIIELLDQGLSPREVADELGIATNYVYNVKRGM